MIKFLEEFGGLIMMAALITIAACMMILTVSAMEVLERQVSLKICEHRNGVDCKLIAVPIE